jgi:WhiB family transcriptional regulator, redox-sensing transcriptional regulator
MNRPRPSTGQARYTDQAACRPYPTRWWFTDEPDSVEAFLVCTGCPVRAACLGFALDHPDLDGIWAATTPEDRARLRRRRNHPSLRLPREQHNGADG